MLPLLLTLAFAAEPTYPPKLPDAKSVVTDTSPDFLKPPAELRPSVTIAKTPPTVDFLFFPGQDYPGKPWSAWGDSIAFDGKYYASIGDHLAPEGNAFVYEYDPAKKTFRQLLDLKKLLNLPAGHYSPGKIHSRLDRGDDDWIYCGTHRGSQRVTNDKYHYLGDWVVRCHPATGKAEVVARGPVPKHCIPASTFDPKRMIFYGGTAPGTGGETDGVQFFALDAKTGKVIYSGPDGPPRYLAFAPSTGRVYFNPGRGIDLARYDPSKPTAPEKLEGEIAIRAASEETPQGVIYTVAQDKDATLYALDTRTEKTKKLGSAAVGSQPYIAAMHASPDGRYLYYSPGAHGSGSRDGSPLVQYDTKTGIKKVIAFLAPFYEKKYGFTPKGTYSLAVDPAGDRVYITWNVNRGSKAWDSCGLTVIHIPESERGG